MAMDRAGRYRIAAVCSAGAVLAAIVAVSLDESDEIGRTVALGMLVVAVYSAIINAVGPAALDRPILHRRAVDEGDQHGLD